MFMHSNKAAVYFWVKQTSKMDGRSDRDLEIGKQVLNYWVSKVWNFISIYS